MTDRAVESNRRDLIDERPTVLPPVFEEQHYPVRYWAQRWGFSEKTVREWFRDETGPGILRQPNVGRRKKRDYTTIMISPSAAARIYAKRTGQESGQRSAREVM